MTETALMAANRHRLRHLSGQGVRGASLALALYNKIERTLSVILLGNTLINAAAAMLTGHIVIGLLGQDKWTLEIGTIFITFCLLVFSEITPKVIAATYPDWITIRVSYVLTPLLRIAYPVTWFVNLFVSMILVPLGLRGNSKTKETDHFSAEELRSLLLEQGRFVAQEHRDILLNLFDLENVTVNDVMLPRVNIEGLNIEASPAEIASRLSAISHSRIPVFENEPSNVIGILTQKSLLGQVLKNGGKIEPEDLRQDLREQLLPPYFIAEGAGLYDQLRRFRKDRQRLGLVVDEYGELIGLLSIEDIIEEIVGKFSKNTIAASNIAWDSQGVALVEGGTGLRELNRQYDLNLPMGAGSPKTLNGLILEHLQEIPEPGISLRIAGVVMEIIQTEEKRIKLVKLYRQQEEESMASDE